MLVPFSEVTDVSAFEYTQDSFEWYTPPIYIEAAKQVMGGPIDLDPASCEEANRYVGAERYFDKETNGLAQEWKAKRLWLNPPGSDKRGVSGIQIWLDKLMAEYENGHVEQAIVMCYRVATETEWFHSVYGRYPVCLHKGRIQFIAPESEGKKNGAKFGNAIVYIGPRMLEFSRVFEKFAPVTPPFLRVPTYSLERIFYKRE